MIAHVLSDGYRYVVEVYGTSAAGEGRRARLTVKTPRSVGSTSSSSQTSTILGVVLGVGLSLCAIVVLVRSMSYVCACVIGIPDHHLGSCLSQRGPEL